jgi:S-sulfo-L-cysteine synthase (O-acetyl-L-serine-dependent)
MATSTETRQILGATLADRIGNTPLMRLDKLTAELPGVTMLGKAEWMNPGGSVKDRAASGIVGAALERGTPRAGIRASPTRCWERRGISR